VSLASRVHLEALAATPLLTIVNRGRGVLCLAKVKGDWANYPARHVCANSSPDRLVGYMKHPLHLLDNLSIVKVKDSKSNVSAARGALPAYGQRANTARTY
jgi:hypothetical protein